MVLKTLHRVFIVTAVVLAIPATVAFAVCPACIFGAGLGVVNAFADKDMYRLGFWLGGLLYLAAKYTQTSLLSRKYGSLEVILPAVILPVPLFFLIAGMAIMAGVTEIPGLNDSVARNLFLIGSFIGVFIAFIGTVGTCLIKTKYSIKIPFFRIMSILSLLWLVSLI